ncbi:unnamed protein product [Oncorhynchus mykiss]|uniref:Uncharacterized protein n=1 Tax=Oncorhynchus mykiss TaxID=8022 RepID=A0A060VTN1_ONCMY|nr:unnamed protein product [Oncorhynchus mykiss]
MGMLLMIGRSTSRPEFEQVNCFTSVLLPIEMCVCTIEVGMEDLERNDGSAERPYLMSDRLLKVLNKKNKPEPAE